MTARKGAGVGVPDVSFSPVDNELPLRWLRRMRLVPQDGLGTVRRAVVLVTVICLPIFTWAAIAGRLVDPVSGEALMRHYGIVVRCLVAVPLFILAESALHSTMKTIASLFMSSGTIPEGQRPAFAQAVADVRRLRDSSLPWVLVLGVTLAWLSLDRPSSHDDALSWAVADGRTLGFGGWWFAYVARPVFIALVLGWLWRILLVVYLFWRIGRLELALVPTHPDRTGGMAFVEKLPGAYAMVTFAMSAVVVSRWAHEISVHGARLEAYTLAAASFAVLWTLFALLPLLMLAPALMRARLQALSTYGKLVGEQGRLVHRRWILGESVPAAPVLDAPEIGPVADAAAMYDAVRNMRIVPIGKLSLAKVLLPLALPMIAVAALQVPVGDMILKIVKAVV